MKNNKWFAVVVSMAIPLVAAHAQPQAPEAANAAGQTQSPGAVPSDMSPGVSEAIRLAESGVGDDVVLAYIQNSQATFNLSADHVLYLRDIGLAPAVTAAMLNHDTAMRGQGQPYPPATQPPPPEPQPEAAQPAVTAPLTPPEYVSTPPPDVDYFYSDLSPYGAWVELAGIGWCWQPRTVVINRGWRPYCDGGHWINSDCGWFWQSDYSWGWAPFHYGRWQLHDRCGWVWLPDRVWGPAWVTWRTGGENCGWAPLPPHALFDARLGWRFNGISVGVNFDFGLRANCFTFVPMHSFNDRDLGHRRLADTQVTTIYRQTTVINNYSVHNNTFVNRGIPVERVAAATHTQIRTVSVREAPKDVRTGGRVPSFDHSGTVVYRREPVATSRATPVVAQKVDDRHPVIQHAPIPTSPSQRSISAGVRGQTPVVTPGRSQPDVPRNSQRLPADRTLPQTQPAPRSYQPPPASRSQQPEPAPRSSYTPPPTRPSAQSEAPVAPSRSISKSSDQSVQSTHSSAPPRPDTAFSAPSRTPARDEPTTSQTDSRAQNSHVYYPKTYHQSSEVRSSSQSSQRYSAPSSASSRESSRESRPSSSSSRDSGRDSQPK